MQAVSAQEMSLNERDFGAQARGASRSHQTSSPGADDDEIVARRGFRVFPVWGMDIGDEGCIVLIMRKNFRALADRRLLARRG